MLELLSPIDANRLDWNQGLSEPVLTLKPGMQNRMIIAGNADKLRTGGTGRLTPKELALE
jgi:hypothetical protein